MRNTPASVIFNSSSDALAITQPASPSRDAHAATLPAAAQDDLVGTYYVRARLSSGRRVKGKLVVRPKGTSQLQLTTDIARIGSFTTVAPVGSNGTWRFDLDAGPLIGVLLEALREAQAAGEVRTQNEALTLIRRLLAESVSGRSE